MFPKIMFATVLFWAGIMVAIVRCQPLDPLKVSYNIDYKPGTPLFPVVAAEDLLVVREGQTVILSWLAVTSATDDSSQSWDITPDWSRTDAMTRFKPVEALGNPVVFNQMITLAQGFWKFRVWSFYDYGSVEKRSKTPSKEVGILIVAPDPETPDAPVSFIIRLQ